MNSIKIYGRLQLCLFYLLPLVAVLLSVQPVARAADTTYKFCVMQHLAFNDSGDGVISDDEWKNTGMRYLANAAASIKWSAVCGGAPTNTYWDGYLSSTGCTPTITMPEHSCIQVWSLRDPLELARSCWAQAIAIA